MFENESKLSKQSAIGLLNTPARMKPFAETLRGVVAQVLSMPAGELAPACVSPVAVPVLKAIVEAVALDREDAQLAECSLALAATLLQWHQTAPGKFAPAKKGAGHLLSLLRDQSGSHLVESIITYCPQAFFEALTPVMKVTRKDLYKVARA